MSSERSVSLKVPRLALWILALLLLAPWIALAAWALVGARAPRAAMVRREPPATAEPTGTGTDLAKASPGPWGDLEMYRILLEPPEEFVLADYTRAEIQPWLFKGYTPQSLATLWREAGLTSAQQRFVDDRTHQDVRPDAVVIHPDREFIISLSPAARGRIYVALGEFPENSSQYNPFRLRTSAADDWLDGAGLPAEAVALTRRLLYQRGTATCFSDESIVLPAIPDAPSRVRLIKALSRKSALVVQLAIRPGQNVDPLVDYWGRGGRSKDLRPLLQSLARRPNGGSIDIVHLVPRFARLLAYTYPLPSHRPIDATHDCHWTSFNFQNEQPDERFSDINHVRQVLLDQYYPVLGEPILGDIILFVRRDGVVVHSCVYIADQVVFTKNGPSFSVPWLFASIGDVQAFYAANPDIEIRRFRRKDA